MMDFNQKTLALGESAQRKLLPQFEKIDEIAFYNTAKVLSAFQKYRVGEGHFAATTGYGYDDRGRDDLERIYADVIRQCCRYRHVTDAGYIVITQHCKNEFSFYHRR